MVAKQQQQPQRGKTVVPQLSDYPIDSKNSPPNPHGLLLDGKNDSDVTRHSRTERMKQLEIKKRQESYSQQLRASCRHRAGMPKPAETAVTAAWKATSDTSLLFSVCMPDTPVISMAMRSPSRYLLITDWHVISHCLLPGASDPRVGSC